MKEDRMIDQTPSPDEILSLAFQLADVAAEQTLKWFRAPALVTQNKWSEGFDPVTEADKAAESAMRALLKVRRPEDSIIGEELHNTTGTSGLSWVLDPIDGTRGYVSGTPTWGTLIALNDGQEPIFGLIDQPYTGERFVGGFGMALWSAMGSKHRWPRVESGICHRRRSSPPSLRSAAHLRLRPSTPWPNSVN